MNIAQVEGMTIDEVAAGSSPPLHGRDSDPLQDTADVGLNLSVSKPNYAISIALQDRDSLGISFCTLVM